MLLYLGSPSSVHHHAMMRLASLDPTRRQKSRWVLPDERLHQVLSPRFGGTPDPLILEAWLEQVLPQDIIRAPEGTWQFLSTLVPDSLVNRQTRRIPGLMPLVSDIVRRGRALGIKTVAGGPVDRLPWPELWSWYDRQLSQGLADTLRLYEYAQRTAKVPGESGGVLFVYGFTRLTVPLLQLLRHWENAGRTVELWGVETLVSESSRERLARFGVRITLLDPVDGMSEKTQIRVPPTLETVDATAGLFAQGRLDPDDAVVVETAAASSRALWRGFRRHELLSKETALADRERALFRLFMRVAQGQARPAMVRRWQKVSGASPEWARDWWTRVVGIQTWHQWSGLFREAADAHGSAWPDVLAWAEAVGGWDSLAAPRGNSPASVLMRLDWPDEESSRNPAVLPAELAVWVPSPHVVLPDPGPGSFPRPVPQTPFDHDAGLRRWIREAPPASQDRRILDGWLLDPAISLWLVGDANGLADHQEEAVMVRSPQSDRHWLDIQKWYRAWRDDTHHSSYTGDIASRLAQPLMPGRLSPSALEDFGRCPLAFLMGRILRVPEGTRSSSAIDPGTLGQWAHRALQLMAEGRRPLSRDQVQAAVDTAMSETPAPDTVPAFVRRYHEGRLTSELYEALLRDGWDPERRMEVEVDLVWDWVWPMHGRIDRLDWLDGGLLRLVDYKTGRTKDPGQPSPANLQLLLYQRAVTRQYQRPVEAELYGISQKSGFQHRPLAPGAAESKAEELDEIGRGMQQRMAAGQFRPVPDPKLQPCRVCAYRLICPASVVDYAEIKHAADPGYQTLWRPEEVSDDAQG